MVSLDGGSSLIQYSFSLVYIVITSHLTHHHSDLMVEDTKDTDSWISKFGNGGKC